MWKNVEKYGKSMEEEEESNTLIIHHASCADGFTAAWVVWRFATYKGLENNGELLPAHYGDKAPDVHGRDVVIVDFSYPKDVLLQMQKDAKSIIVMDHHKSVPEDVRELDFVIFDNDRSGAGIVWDYFHDYAEYPRDEIALAKIIDYVEDRDLWTWDQPLSKEISAALSVVKMNMDDWGEFAASLVEYESFEAVAAKGSAILAYQQKTARSQAWKATMRNIRGFEVPTVNATTLQSEIGNDMFSVFPDAPFSASWFMRVDSEGNDLIQFSLRSEDHREDVGAIAKTFGGGGHRNAAGFTIQLSELFEGLK